MMMVRSGPILAAVLVAATAQAAPLDGRWGLDPQVCTAVDGDFVPVVIKGDDILYYESECTVTEWKAIGDANAAWKATMSCAGEGEEWETETILALIEDGEGNPSHHVQLNTEMGRADLYYYCGE